MAELEPTPTDKLVEQLAAESQKHKPHPSCATDELEYEDHCACGVILPDAGGLAWDRHILQSLMPLVTEHTDAAVGAFSEKVKADYYAALRENETTAGAWNRTWSENKPNLDALSRAQAQAAAQARLEEHMKCCPCCDKLPEWRDPCPRRAVLERAAEGAK